MAEESSGTGREFTAKIPISPETKEWIRNQDTELPVRGNDISGFKEWVNWNGFRINRQVRTKEEHSGFDFAAYVNQENQIVLGLPQNTPIRAVADGRVAQVLDIPEVVGGGYGIMINVEHGVKDSGMFSSYVHVVPEVKEGDEVKKGDVIARLYKDPDGKEGRLVHLHFELINGWGTRGSSIFGGGKSLRIEDPKILSDDIYTHNAEPQGNSSFRVESLPNSKIRIANFSKIRV